MTTALYLTDITDAISQIIIPGVTVRDYDEVVSSWKAMPYVLYPNPENFMVITGISYPSVLQGGNAPVNLTYTLNYRYLATQIGGDGNVTGWAEMVEKLKEIIARLLEVDSPYSGLIEMRLGAVTVGAKSDPAGNMYHGADIALTITEMQN